MTTTSNTVHCPRCSRPLTEVDRWGVWGVLEQEHVHDEARGICEIHGVLHLKSTPSGGWEEQK